MSDGDLRIAPVDDGAGLKDFIALPRRIYAADPMWIPPLEFERRGHLNRKANPFFAHADTAFWLAWRNGRPVGRISAQIDRMSLAQHGDATGHFGFFEAEDDPAVFAALFRAAEEWLRRQGMSHVRGPFSLSINDESGLLVDGFDTAPFMMMGHAPTYYGDRIEQQGYAKAKDLLAYLYDFSKPLPAFVETMAEKARASHKITVRSLTSANYARDISMIMEIFNDAWSDNWGFVPFDENEIQHVANELKPLLREDFVCIADVDGKPAAMMVGLPNLNEAIRDLNGRLLPFGWAKLLWRLKFGTVTTARVPLMGVRRAYHRTPVGAALACAIISRIRASGIKHGVKRVEASWILEDNMGMRRLVESAGCRHYKTYRVYEKALA